MENISHILTISGISIIAFLITLFLGNVLKAKTNVLLVIILFAFIPLFLSYNLEFIKSTERILVIIPFTCFSLLLIGPLLYEYSFHFFTANRQRLFERRKKYLPFLFAALLILGARFFLKEKHYSIVLVISLSLSFLHLFYYLIVLVRYQMNSTRMLKQLYANLSNKNLFWVNILIIGLIIVLLLDSVTGIVTLTTGFTGVPIINTFFLLILIWFLGYYGLTQKEITESIEDLNPSVESEFRESTLFCESKEFIDLQRKLSQVLNEKELYKVEDINLSLLSQHLEVSTKKVSLLLNRCMNTTFYDLMNAYRLSEFKRKVENGEIQEKTILALAFESGFNSKASFNRIFKQKEGKSPNEYVKSLRSSE